MKRANKEKKKKKIKKNLDKNLVFQNKINYLIHQR